MRIRQSVGRAVAFVFAALVSLPAQNLPDFSGVWQLNKEKSRVEVRMAWAKVELTDAIFSVNLRVLPERGGEETSDWHFTMGSSESSNLMHGAPVKSHVERDGGTVVVRSVTMFGSDRLNTIARWAASPDGQTLTYTENHQYANGPERDSVFVFDRRPATTWPAAQSQPAEKVFKNVRALRSVAAEQVPAIMATFTRSLGVQCTHCHAAGDFAADTNPAKATARKMSEMVSAINRQSFTESEGITCWTCHRGSVKPEREKLER